MKVKLIGDPEPEGLWLPEGMSWSGKDRNGRFATFTRPIPRKRPPPDPAGLSQTSEEGRSRWASDAFRYPPYTYEEGNLLLGADGRLHKLPSYCREVLMGFKRGHTRMLDRELFKGATFGQAEDVRCAAIGNSFHTTTVALLLGAILAKWGWIPVAPNSNMLNANLLSEHLEDVYQGPHKSGDSDLASEASRDRSPEHEEDLEELLVSEFPQPDLDEEHVHQSFDESPRSPFLEEGGISGVRHTIGHVPHFQARIHPTNFYQSRQMGVERMPGLSMAAF